MILTLTDRPEVSCMSYYYHTMDRARQMAGSSLGRPMTRKEVVVQPITDELKQQIVIRYTALRSIRGVAKELAVSYTRTRRILIENHAIDQA